MTTPFYSPIVFFFALAMAIVCFGLFAYIAISELRAHRREATRSGPSLEGMSQVGDLAEKFAKSGYAPSALACSVLFILLGTAIALALDKLTILPSLFK